METVALIVDHRPSLRFFRRLARETFAKTVLRERPWVWGARFCRVGAYTTA